MNKILALTLYLIIILSIVSPIVTISQTYGEKQEPWMNKIHPIFLKKIMGLSDDTYVTAVIRLKPLPENIAMNVKGHYRLAVNTLKYWADITQKPVIDFIVNNGGIVLNRFWLDNVILVRVKLSLLKKIAMLPNVVKIFENFEVRIIGSAKATVVNTTQQVTSWGIFKIRAPDVWAKGYTGEGIRICVLDTGVDPTHPALNGKLLTIDPDNPYYPGGWMEFDDYGNPVLSTPHDTYGHGTHVSGTALGGDTENILIGVAPGATLMAGLVLPGGSGTFAQILGGMQWAVEPFYIDPDTGEIIYTNLPAHIVSMSFGAANYYGSELLPGIKAILLANIIPVAAIGNEGEGSSSNPGNIWGVIGVGATDQYDNVAYFSSGEEVSWPAPPEEWPFYDTYPSTYIKPDISAPGVGITSSVPGGGYESWDGTSMATPHVSGTIALILEAAGWTNFDQPDLPELVYEILTTTAIDLGDPGQDIRYGWGRIDAFEAVLKAEEYAKKSGVEGYVYDKITGEPIPWTTVTVQETGTTVKVNESGYFKIPLDPGTYHLVFEAFGYQTLTLEIEVKMMNGTIAGFVYDMFTETPIEGAFVTVEELNLTVSTGPNGEFQVSVPPGTYTVTAYATGYSNETKTIDVGENETVIVTFYLVPLGNGTIVGQVTDAETGEPIENAYVWVYVDNTIVGNFTDENGYYMLSVPAGTYTVYARALGYREANVSDVEVAPNTLVVVNFTLEPLPPVVVVLGNVDYYTEAHLATIIADAGYPVVEYNSMEDLLEDWLNGEIYPKVIVIDHTESNEYDYPSSDILISFLLLADSSGTSLIWLGTSYSGYTGLDVLYMYREDVEAHGYPAPDEYDSGYPSPENVIVYMVNPEHPVFENITPDDSNWFYLADLENSFYADYRVYYFENDENLTILAYVNDTLNDVSGVGVAIWYSSSGVPWFYLGSWAESYWMQYLEPGGDGQYSNNTMKVLLNVVSLGWMSSSEQIVSDKIKSMIEMTLKDVEFESRQVRTSAYTFVEVYLDREPYGWVKGQVIGSDNIVLAGAKITVLGTPINVVTDENGFFEFWLPAGEYTLLITYQGYYEKTLDITIVVNETIDLGVIVLQRQPRVAILYDYATTLKQFVETLGFYGKDYTNLTMLNNDLATGFYDLVIYAGYYNVPYPSQEDFMEFLNITSTMQINVIWMDSYGDYGYGIKVLHKYLGDPESIGYDYGEGKVYIAIEKSHPIFSGYRSGDVVEILSSTSADFAWFTGFSGETLASLVVGDNIYGDAIAYKILPSGCKWLLMASFAPTSWNTPDIFTEDAWIILANAITWSVMKILNITLENPYLYVGDTAILHISRAPANAVVDIFIDTTYVMSVECDENGEATAEFIIPLIPGGEHIVTAISRDYTHMGSTTLYILPKLTVYPSETTSPGQVHILVTGLYVNATAFIYIDANYLTMIRANVSGAFEGIINIPMVVTGEHLLSLVDKDTGEILYNVSIHVTSIFDELASNMSKIDRVINTTENISGKLDSIIVILNNINDSIMGVDEKVSQIIIDLQSLSGKVDNVIEILNNITGTIEAIHGDLVYVKTRVGTIIVKIDELNATLIGLIVSETGKVYTLLNTSIGIITARINELKDLGLNITDNLSEIYNDIIGKLDHLISLVEKLNTNVNTLTTKKIPTLEKKINDTKDSVTTASAYGISGLSLAIIALLATIYTFLKRK